jgi:hypothetical protein
VLEPDVLADLGVLVDREGQRAADSESTSARWR